MNLSLKLDEHLSAADRTALRALTKAIYPPGATVDDPEDSVAWAGTPWRVLVWDDQNHLVSHVGALTRQGTFNAKPVLIGGIGGVKTAPTARGRGYAGAALERATTFLVDECGVDFLLLVCRPRLLNYYGRLGWSHFRGDLFVEQPGGHVVFTVNETMIHDGRSLAPLDGAVDLGGLPW